MTDAALKDANALRQAVSRMARRIRSLRAVSEMGPSKLSVLGLLMRAEGPMTIGELARLERLQPQTLTRVVAELDAEGLLTRTVDPGDRRQMPMTITQAGRDLMIADARRQNAWISEAMQGLNDTERGVLNLAAAILDRLASESGSTKTS